MEDELDLNLSPVHKPKQGRRAGAAGAAGAGAGNAFGEDSAGGGGGGGGDVLFGSPLRGRPQTTDELFLDDAPPRRVRDRNNRKKNFLFHVELVPRKFHSEKSQGMCFFLLRYSLLIPL